ncbi:hypothetical protein Tco_0147456, partial [Tanacetum coccineum]
WRYHSLEFVGVGGRKATEGGRGGGRDGRSKGIRKETRNLVLKKITDEYGPLKIRFEWNDKGTMLHLSENSARWSNLVGEIVREFQMSSEISKTSSGGTYTGLVGFWLVRVGMQSLSTSLDVDVDELKEEAKRTRRELQLLRTVVSHPQMGPGRNTCPKA